MTIATGFKCRDGIVLCADRQIGNDSFKYYEEKLSHVNLKGGVVTLAYAGLPERTKAILASLSDKVEDQSKSCSEVQADLQSSLDAELPPKVEHDSDTHELFCAIGSGGQRLLLKARNREISPVEGWDFIGVGDSALIRYLVGIATKSPVIQSVWQARIFCTYLVAQAKKYVQWVGGRTDVMVINDRDQLEYVHGIYSDALESKFEDAEYAMQVLLLTLSERRSTKADCDMAIARFSDFLKDFAVVLRGHL